MSTRPALRRQAHGPIRIVIVLIMMYGFALAAAPTAHAGGPTSVLVSSQAGVTAVGYGDQRYLNLRDMMDAMSVPTPVSSPPISEGGGLGARDYLLTWLIHDRSVWRTDIVRQVDDQVWIETRIAIDGSGLEHASPVFHQARHPQALMTQLDLLPAVGRAESGRVWPRATTTTDLPSSGPPPEPEKTAATRLAAVAPAGVVGLAGTVVGLLAGLGIARYRSRAARPPRVELTDVDPPGSG